MLNFSVEIKDPHNGASVAYVIHLLKSAAEHVDRNAKVIYHPELDMDKKAEKIERDAYDRGILPL